MNSPPAEWGVDHFVLTVADIDATCEFYRRVLGIASATFGAGDFCLITSRP